MTAQELIKILKRFPKDAEVVVNTNSTNVNSTNTNINAIQATVDQDGKWSVVIITNDIDKLVH